LAEIAEKYLRKGNQVYIEGKLQTRSYQDKDGITKYSTEVVGQNMNMLGGRSTASEANHEPSNQSTTPPANPVDLPEETDDLPF